MPALTHGHMSIHVNRLVDLGKTLLQPRHLATAHIALSIG
jgi:hypothetical protein